MGAGLRADRVTKHNDGGFFGDQSTDNAALSGYGSLKVELGGGFNLTGQFAHGFRDPTLSDRYFRGISGRGIVIGNPTLEPEQANQFDAALRFVSRRVRWAVYGYFYRFDDLIERFEILSDVFLFRNRGKADIRGLELEVQSELADDYIVEVSTQIARGNTRGEAILRMRRALDSFVIEGIKTNLPLQQRILAEEDFVRGRISTSFMDRFSSSGETSATG